jgi:aldehyde dehydrogenase (NAD+)
MQREGPLSGGARAGASWGGGYKQSGVGREMRPEGLRAYEELKSIAPGPA